MDTPRADAPLLRLSVHRAVWVVAWPMVLLGWIRATYLVADTWWVAKLGTAELTALGVASFGWWILDQLSELAGLGVHAVSARREGEGRREEVGRVLGHGVVVAAGLWVVAMGIAALGNGPYLDAMGVTDPVVAGHVRAFLGAASVAWLGLFAQALVTGVFRGLGRTRPALVMSALGLLINVLLDPVLIWGVGGVRGLGVAGAAWATGAAALCSAGFGLVVLVREGLHPRLGQLSSGLLRDIVRIGGPVAVTGVAFSLVYVILGRIVVPYGGANMAALGLGHRLESFVYLASVGFSVAAATLVGQNLGAGRPDGAAEAVETSARACSGFMVGGGVVALLAADLLVATFSDDPVVRTSAAMYLRIQALIWIGMGFEMVYEGAFAGAGHTTPALVIIAGLTAVRIPLAWALAGPLGLGVPGIWLAIGATTLAKGLALRGWWGRGTWRGVALSQS